MIHPFTIVTIILANGYLIIGLEMINNNPSRKLSLAGGGNALLIALFFFISAITKNSSNLEVFLFWNKLGWMVAIFAIAMLPYSSRMVLSSSKEVGSITIWLSRINLVVGVILTSLLYLTNIFSDNTAVKAANSWYTNWYPVTNPAIVTFLIFGTMSAAMAILNSSKLDINSIKGNSMRRVMLLTVGGTFLAMIAIILAAIGTMTSYRNLFPFEAFGEMCVLLGSFIGYFAIRYADLYIGDHIFVHRQIKNMMLTSGLWTLTYVFVAVLIFPIIGSPHSTILLASMVALTVTTASIVDRYVNKFFSWLNKNHDIQLSITDTAYILRYFNRSIRLEQTDLANSPVIKRIADNRRQNEVDVIRELVREAVKTMAPKGAQNRRTQKAIKYEILRMTVFEAAKESNILWDLGFDCTSINSSLDSKPRYAVTSNSEYSSTSIPSFRRIKHEAIEELTWRLLKLLKS